MAQALCVSTVSGADFSRYGCPSGYMPMYLPNNTDTVILGERVGMKFIGFVDLEPLGIGGGGAQVLGIFHSIPVQDVLVAVFLFVMFGIGFAGGVLRR